MAYRLLSSVPKNPRRDGFRTYDDQPISKAAIPSHPHKG